MCEKEREGCRKGREMRDIVWKGVKQSFPSGEWKTLMSTSLVLKWQCQVQAERSWYLNLCACALDFACAHTCTSKHLPGHPHSKWALPFRGATENKQGDGFTGSLYRDSCWEKKHTCICVHGKRHNQKGKSAVGFTCFRKLFSSWYCECSY